MAADGTIDWWCPGRFDGDAAFYRILDGAGGALRVGPAAGAGRELPAGAQEYDGESHVLRTVTRAGEAEIEVVDLLPWRGTGHRAEGRILRVVTARRGPVEVDVSVQPARRWRAARDVHAWSAGIAFDGVVVRTGCDMNGERGAARLDPGERMVITVDVEPADGGPLPPPVSVDGALDRIERTRSAWASRLQPLTYSGPFEREVRRSLLVLLGLTYAPSGTVVAAPTTSMPERVGGDRNWDYRYAWIRDASLAVDACYDAGLREEGEHFLRWLTNVCQWSEFPMRPFYSVDGTALDAGERELPLAGWRGSQPVRDGNAAADHVQLDFYADLVSVLHEEQMRDADSLVLRIWPDMLRMGEWLSDAWRSKDRGIWEVRCEPRHLVGSKLACWYTLDRLARLESARDPLSLAAASLRLAARDVLEWIRANGTAADGGLRADMTEADVADASLLTMAWRNPWPGEPWRVERTVDRILRRLGAGAFVHRYDSSFADGLEPGEGAFLACSFWAVEALARLGRWEEAHERMEVLCAAGAPLGLLPEEVDPATGEWLGNHPQALSHLALIQAALALADGPR